MKYPVTFFERTGSASWLPLAFVATFCLGGVCDSLFLHRHQKRDVLTSGELAELVRRQRPELNVRLVGGLNSAGWIYQRVLIPPDERTYHVDYLCSPGLCWFERQIADTESADGATRVGLFTLRGDPQIVSQVIPLLR